MSSEAQGKAKKQRILTVAVIAIIIALFIPVIPSTYLAYELRTSTTQKLVTELSTEWVTRTYHSYTTALNTVTRTFINWEQGEVVEPGYCLYGTTTLKAGSDIAVKWRTDEKAEVRVYDEIEGRKWLNEEKAEPLATKSGTEGMLPLHISATGTYYFVICNPNTGFLGIGAKKLAVLEFTVSGTTFEKVTITQTLTTREPITHTTTRWVPEPVVYTETVTKTEYKSVLQKLLEAAR